MERYYRTLKYAPLTHLHQENWMEHLSLILLWLRVTVKRNLNCPSVELLYGTRISLASQSFFIDHRNFLTLRRFMTVDRLSNLVYKASAKGSNLSFIPILMKSSTYVFVRDQAKFSALQLPYWGPYKAIERHKFFSVRIGKNLVNILLDKLKPGYLDHTWLDVQHTNTWDSSFHTSLDVQPYSESWVRWPKCSHIIPWSIQDIYTYIHILYILAVITVDTHTFICRGLGQRGVTWVDEQESFWKYTKEKDVSPQLRSRDYDI